MVQILPLLLAVLCSVCFADELFLDNFNDGDDLGWTHLGAAGFQVIDEEYYIHALGDRGTGKSLNGDNSGVMSTTDYSVLCSILIECGTEAGILARYQGEDDWYYRIILKPQASAILLQRKKDSGVLFGLDEYSYSLEFGVSYWIRLQVQGESIKGRIWQGSVEDEPDLWHMEATDPFQLNAGSFGLFAGGYGKEKVSWSSVFDDVLVTTPLSGQLSPLTWGSIKTVDY